MSVHGADLKKYINAVSLRIVADAKEYGVAAVMVLLYAGSAAMRWRST